VGEVMWSKFVEIAAGTIMTVIAVAFAVTILFIIAIIWTIFCCEIVSLVMDWWLSFKWW